MKYINYILLVVGAATAFYSDTFTDYNQKTTVLVVGMVLMMLGIYRISRGLRSRSNQSDAEENSQNE
ncbi:hypothetical protein V8G61_08280 [Gaetbulibacter sp. M240]|uniref:hypothetical protein n=1 Tax=Gaetbulibacter sp. M240 TaxID=3126511 RepID=UPI00374E2320